MLNKPEDNLIKIFENSLRDNWELAAVSDYGQNVTFTYGELARDIAKLHILFREAGLKQGDRVALMGKNNCNWVIVYLATITFGGVIVPILQDFPANDAAHLMNHSEAKLLFISDRIWENIDPDQVPDIRAVISIKTRAVLLCRGEHLHVDTESIDRKFNKKYPSGFHKEDIRYADRSNAELASINYTSGTTGFSKGVMTPANALAGNLKFARETRQVFRGCRHVVFLPLAHAYGCAIDFLGVLACGGHSYLIGRTPSPKILIQAFQEVRPTLIMSVPLILEKIYKKQIAPQIAKPPLSWVLKVPYLETVVLDKIREQLVETFGGQFTQMIIGGAPLNKEVEDFLQKIHFPVTVGYGMTECAPLISYTYWENYKPHSCGQALPGLMDVRIHKPDKDGVGEVEVHGENVMTGYYKNEEATKQTFTKDGWLKTGDLGYVDEDGFLYLKGRNKTMLLGPSGQNIYPEEIEAKLNNMPYVLESLVLQKEAQLVALVCPDYDAMDANHMTREQLEEAMEKNRVELNAELAAYEPITRIQLYPKEFEKTPKKSIKRFLYTV